MFIWTYNAKNEGRKKIFWSWTWRWRMSDFLSSFFAVYVHLTCPKKQMQLCYYLTRYCSFITCTSDLPFCTSHKVLRYSKQEHDTKRKLKLLRKVYFLNPKLWRSQLVSQNFKLFWEISNIAHLIDLNERKKNEGSFSLIRQVVPKIWLIKNGKNSRNSTTRHYWKTLQGRHQEKNNIFKQYKNTYLISK